jgi:hypothetical protein
MYQFYPGNSSQTYSPSLGLSETYPKNQLLDKYRYLNFYGTANSQMKSSNDWENMEIKNLNEKFYNKQFLYMLIYFMTLSF